MKQHIVSFSGGKDSTAMLLMMIERGMQIDRVICIDTTKEFPGMYAHIKKVQDMVPMEIDIFSFNFDYWFAEHVKTKGKNIGKKGYGWPDFRNRWCTAHKRELFKKEVYGKGSDIVEYHGIAADEAHRTHKNNDGRDMRYPLVEWRITEPEALQYCYDKGLDYGGLYRDFGRTSCFCCPLSRIGELRTVFNKYPEQWAEMMRMDKLSFRKFRSDYSLQELHTRFENEKLPNN